MTTGFVADESGMMRALSIRRHIRNQRVQCFILGLDQASVPAQLTKSLQLAVPLQRWKATKQSASGLGAWIPVFHRESWWKGTYDFGWMVNCAQDVAILCHT